MSNYKFTPGIFPTVIFILLLPLFLVLGNWQLDRGDEKKIIRDRYHRDLSAQAIAADGVTLKDIKYKKDLVYKKIKATAALEKPIILLENRLYQGQSGYYVFVVSNIEQNNILTNLGWIAGNPDRNKYPTVNIPERLELIGVLKAAPYSGIKLSDTPIEKLSDSVLRVQSIDFDQLNKTLGIELYPYVLRLEEQIAADFVIDWPELKFDSNKHYGYAFQWFSFAAILIFLFIYLNLHKIKDEK